MQKKSLFTPRKLFMWICIIFIAISMNFLNIPSESERFSIVTAIAIDIIDDEFYAGINTLSPTDTKQVKEKVFLAHGDNMTDAVENLSLLIGKELGFAHCNIIAIGDNLARLGIPQHIDNLIRTKKVDRNSLIVTFNGEIKDFLESIAYLKKELSLDPQVLFKHNKQNIQSTATIIEEYYSDYYSENGVSITSALTLTNEEGEGIEISSPSSGGGQDSSSGSTGGDSSATEKKYLKNDGTTSIFKEGKKVLELNQEQMRQVNLFRESTQKGTIQVDGVTDYFYNDATIIFEIKKQVTKLKPTIKNNEFKMLIKSELDIRVIEIQEDERDFDILKINDNYVTPTVKEMLIDKVDTERQAIIEVARQHDIDFLGVYEKFNKKDYKKWHEFLDSLEDSSSFLDYVDFEIQPSIRTVSF